MQQLSIFAQVYDTYKSKKPLRLIELFAGYGSQALALKYMGVPFEHYRVCEWNWKSNYAYALMHDLYQEYDTGMTKDEIIMALQGKGLSPRECFRLMGVRDEDFDKIKDKFSDSTLYHLAGDSIVTTVLMAVLAPMFDKEEKFDYKDKECEK